MTKKLVCSRTKNREIVKTSACCMAVGEAYTIHNALLMYIHYLWYIMIMLVKKWKMAARVYIAWCKRRREFGRIWKFMWTQASGDGLHKYINSTKLSRVFASGYIKTGLFIFYFFYKIILRNMLWRHNRVRITWYKHSKLTNHSVRKTQLIL